MPCYKVTFRPDPRSDYTLDGYYKAENLTQLNFALNMSDKKDSVVSVQEVSISPIEHLNPRPPKDYADD